MFSGSKSFFRNPTGGGVVTPTDASFFSVPLLLETTSAVTGKSTTVSDAATPSGSFTVNGSPTFGSTSPYQPDGYWSNYFGGTSNWLNSTASTVLQFGSNAYTVEGWIYQTSRAGTTSSTYQFICGGQFSGTGYQVIIFDSGYIAFGIPGFAALTAATIAIPLNTWTHFAIVRTSTSAGGTAYYINGAAAGTLTDANNYSGTATTLNVAATNNTLGGNPPLTGYLSNFRIVKGVAVYTGAFTPPTTPLQATQPSGTNIAAITGTATALLTCQSNSFKDNSTNNYTITPSGTPSVSAETPLQTDGYWSNYFGGTSDYLTYNQNFALGTNNFTLEFWLNIPVDVAYPTNYWLWGWRTGAASCPSLYLGGVSGGGNTLTFGGYGVLLSNPNAIPTNTWTHVAIVRSGLGTNNLKMYINGVQVAQSSTTQSFTYTGTQPVGANPSGDGGLYPSNVYISNFRIVNGTAVYTAAFTPSTTPLTGIANTSLLTCQSSSFKDNSTNNFTITRNGSPVTKSVTQPFISSITSNGAALFNGSSYLQFPAGTAFAPGTGDFTVECWVYVITHNVAQGNWIYSQSASGHNYFVITFGPSGAGFTAASSGAGTGIGNSTTINTNTWYHIAVTRSSGIVRVFVNGVSGTPTSNTTDLSNVSYVPTIGSYSHAVYGLWNGYISNFRYVKGVAVYTGNFTPPSNFLTTTGGTYPSTSNVTTSIVSTNTSMLANFNDSTYSSSSTLNTVSRNGTPTTGWISPYQTDGYWGNYFNGSTDYLTSSGSPVIGTNDFTIEGWVYTSTYASFIVLIDFRAASTNGVYPYIYINTDGTVRFYVSTADRITGATAITLNAWNHIAVSRTSSVTKLFLNGIQQGSNYSDTNSYLCGASRPAIASSGFTLGSGLLNGYISNLRVVNGTGVYTGNFTPPTSPLQAIQSSGTNITAITGTQTSLLTCQSNRFKDNSTNAFAITTAGTPQITPYYYPSGFTAPTASLGAGYFNGNGSYLTIPNNPALRPGTSDFTLECWVYWSGTNSGNATIFNILGSAWSGYSQTGQWIFYIDPTGGVVRFQVWNSVGVAAATALVQNRWYHIAVTRSSNTFKLYLNGKLDATNTISLDASTTVWDFYIGTYYDPSGPTYYGYFPGYLSDLRLVLNTVVYTGDFTPPSGRLTQTGGTYPSTTNVNTSIPAPNTRLLLNFAESNYISASTGVNNNTFIDDSNYAYTITRNGTPTQGSFTPYWPNGYWSNYFGTNGDYISVPDSANVELGANNFQMDAWVYLTAYPASNLGSYASSILAKGNFAGTRSYEFNISGASGTDLGVALTNAGGTTTNIGSAFSFALNTWYSVRASRVSNRVYLFVNGTLLNAGGTAYSDTVSNGTDALKVGRANLDVNYVFQLFGYVSNVSLAIGGTGYSTASYTPATTPTVATADTRFLSCQSNTFKDNSVNNALVTASGTPSAQAFAPFSTGVAYSPVLHGGSGYFKGSPDYLYTPINTAFTFGTNNFTVEYWLNLSSTSGGRVSCTLGNATTFDPLMGYFAAGESTFRVYLSSNNSSWDISNGSTLSYAMSLNSWYHVAVVRNGSNIALYVNGSSVGSITSSASIYQSANDIIIGLGQTSFYFPGYISNFRFTRAAVYTAAFTPPIAPLKAIPNTNLLLNFTNAAIYDASAQNDVTTVGDTQSSTTIFKWAPTSMKFDGTGDYLNLSTGSPQSLTFGTGDFTIEFWVYFTSNTGTQTLYDGRAGVGTYPLLYINGLSGGVITYYVGSSAVITSVQPSINTWYFMSLRRSSGTTQFFINGVQSGGSYSDSNNYLAPPTSGARVGANYVADSFLFGYIQDLRISKTARPVTPIPTAAFPTR